MEPFDKCPRCGLLGSWRVNCTCGYKASHAPTEPTTKPSVARRIIAVLLVVPIALCAVTVMQWIKGQEFLGLPPGGILLEIVVGAVGLGLLGLANYLWTGKTRDERTG